MSSKKQTPGATNDSMQKLRIGSRVRSTEDGVEGRIAWANAVWVKVKWDDGEVVTWRRGSLAGRAIEIFGTDEDAEQSAATPIAEHVEQVTAEAVAEHDAPTETPVPEVDSDMASPERAVAAAPQTTDAAVPEQPAEMVASDAASPAPQQTAGTTLALTIYTPETPTPTKPKRQGKAKTPTEPKEKRLSALDAAAKVLAEAGVGMTTQEMIGAMAIKGYWSSPGGKTPSSTLYSALTREIDTKGEQARFVKAAPGRFALRTTA
jgi:hypothetical protein